MKTFGTSLEETRNKLLQDREFRMRYYLLAPKYAVIRWSIRFEMWFRKTILKKKTVRGWSLPKTSVEICPKCGSKVMPVALQEDEGWILSGYDCENYCNKIDDYTDHEWPFIADVASWKDFDAIGFITV